MTAPLTAKAAVEPNHHAILDQSNHAALPRGALRASRSTSSEAPPRVDIRKLSSYPQ